MIYTQAALIHKEKSQTTKLINKENETLIDYFLLILNTNIILKKDILISNYTIISYISIIKIKI